MNTYEINGEAYPITAYIQTEQFGIVPIVGLKLMSDEEWNASARRDFLRRYETEHGPQNDFPEKAYRAWNKSVRQRLDAELGETMRVPIGGTPKWES